jgi:hypothetical protein
MLAVLLALSITPLLQKSRGFFYGLEVLNTMYEMVEKIVTSTS